MAETGSKYSFYFFDPSIVLATRHQDFIWYSTRPHRPCVFETCAVAAVADASEATREALMQDQKKTFSVWLIVILPKACEHHRGGLI